MSPLLVCLLTAAVIFSVGFAGVVTRRNAIVVLIGIELMLNAANLNFIAFWRFGPHPEALTGLMFAVFSIAVAAAEASVGLALVIAIYRHHRTVKLNELEEASEARREAGGGQAGELPVGAAGSAPGEGRR